MKFDEEYFNSDEFKDLLYGYEAAVEAGEHPFLDADDLVDIADYYNYSGDYDKATATIAYALSLFPHATLPNVFMARKALYDGDFERARQYADSIDSKDDPDYHYLVAEILIAEERTDEADRYLRDYARTVDDDEYQDFVKDCANLYIDYGIGEKAYEWMMRVKGDDSDDFKELMANTLFRMGKYKDSARVINELIDRHPYSKDYWNSLATSQFMDEDYSNAIASSEFAIAIDPDDPEGLSSKANSLFRLGNYEEALDYFQRYGQIIPDDPYVILNQAACLVSLGKKDEAVKLMERVLQSDIIDDDELEAQYCQELAFCYSSMKRPREAIELLDKTLDLPCDHMDMMVIRGHILLENGLAEEAEAVYRKIILEAGNRPSVLLRVIVSLYDNGYAKASYDMFKVYFKFVSDYHPDFQNGYAYMALCCLELNKMEEFLHYLQLAVKHCPQEVRLTLSHLFPPDIKADEYYDYIIRQLSKSK